MSKCFIIRGTEVLNVDDSLSKTSTNPVQNKVISTALDEKQATLVSGTNIKTINSNSIIGSGNIEIKGATDYTELENKPSINGTTLVGDITVDTGKVDDVQVNGTTVVSNKVANIDLSTYDTIKAREAADTTITNSLNTHTSNTSNPHKVTKAQLSLGNVDNTSDLDKPISTATQTALDKKLNSSDYVVDTALSSTSTNPAQNKVINTAITNLSSNKVDKIDGKSLSTNDFTTALKTKLEGIAEGANKTVIENVLTSDSTTNALSAAQGKALSTKIDEAVSSVYKVCGSVANYDALPTTATKGDVYNLLDTGVNYVWTGSEWDSLAGIVDLSDYLKSADAANTYATKASLSAVATSGSYNDLANKPTIPSVVDNLTSTSSANALSANQGKILKDLIDTKTSNVGTITGIKMNGSSKGTSGVVDLGTVITAHQDISGKANTADLATVATSGSYNDLKDKPTITSGTVTSVKATNGLTGGTITSSGEIGLEEYTSFIDNIGVEFDKYGRAVTSFRKWLEKVSANGAYIDGAPFFGTILETDSSPDESDITEFLQSAWNAYGMDTHGIMIEGNDSSSFSIYQAMLTKNTVTEYATLFTSTSVTQVYSFSDIPTAADKITSNPGYVLYSFDGMSVYLIGCTVNDGLITYYVVDCSSNKASLYSSLKHNANTICGVNTIPFYSSENSVPIDTNQYYWLTGSKREYMNILKLGTNPTNPTLNSLTWGGDLTNISEISTKTGSDYTYWTYKDIITNTWIYFIYLESAWRGYIPVDQVTVHNYTAGDGVKIDDYIISLDSNKGYTADFTLATGATSVTITHDLNTLDVIVQVYNKTTNANVIVDVTRTGLNTIQLDFNETSTDTYRVLITNTTGLSNKNIAASYKNISVSVTPTAVSSYQDWDTNQEYGYSATISITGITENSLILNFVASDSITGAISSIIDSGENCITVYTKTNTTLSGTIFTISTIEVS